jgi:hypothetical protein
LIVASIHLFWIAVLPDPQGFYGFPVTVDDLRPHRDLGISMGEVEVPPMPQDQNLWIEKQSNPKQMNTGDDQ